MLLIMIVIIIVIVCKVLNLFCGKCFIYLNLFNFILFCSIDIFLFFVDKENKF